MINQTIFREYDIRGEAGRDFEDRDFELIGRAFGTYIQKISGKNLLVGRDNRFTSDSISAYLIEGLLATGCNIVDTGLSLRPIIQTGILKEDFDGGLMVTGSHNPPEYNGVKFFTKGGFPIFGKEIAELKKLFYSKNFKQGHGKIAYTDVSDLYFAEISKNLEAATSPRQLKVVVDAGNGTASKFAPKFLHQLGYKVLTIHCNLIGSYPFHVPNPEVRVNTLDLSRKVREEHADLGIAFDTDGDRFGVVDEEGNFYESDRTLIILARYALEKHPGAKILFDVKSSYILEEEIKKSGGVPIMVRTGHPFIQEAMKEDPKIVLGGELSGHTMFRENNCFDDGFFAACKLLEILNRSGKKYSELYKGIPKTECTPEIKAYCPDEDKFEVVEKVKNIYKKKYRVIELDGARVLFSDTSWALVRASNTTPSLSLRFEAQTKKELKRLMEDMQDKLEEFPQVDLSQLRLFLEA